MHQLSERSLRALMAMSREVMALLSRDGAVFALSGDARTLFGRELAALTGRPLIDLVHPDDRAVLAQALTGGGSGSGRRLACRLRHADGRWIQAEAGVFDRLDDPDLRAIVVALRDVTDRVEAERVYRKLAEAAPVGVFQSDPEGRMLFVNPRLADIAGRAPEALLDHGWRAAVHPDDRPRLAAEWARAVTGGPPMRLDLRVRGADGATVPVLCRTSSLRDDDGRFLGCVGTVLDRSEEVRTVEALRLAEARTDAIVDTAADAILTIDEDGIVHSFNRAAEAMFAVPAAEILHRPVDRLIPEAGAAGLHACPGDGAGHGAHRSGVRLARRGDGTHFPIELSVSVIAVGGRRLFTGIIRDITERTRIERELVAAKEAAESADHAKSAFLATMSHELRTPLNAVIGFAQVIEMQLFGPADMDRYSEYASSIRRSGEHLLGIIEDILDISRIEAGGLTLTDEPVDPVELLRQGLDLVAIQAGQRGVALSLDLAADAPPVRGDALRLRQVLVNLLSNAIKFSGPGGLVTVGARRSGQGGVELFVRDTGIGMTAEDIATALVPFAQVDQSLSRRYGGTGLGLPLTKRLVELHGGTLAIDSAPGRGTTITVHLPAGRVLAGAEPPSLAEPGAPGA